MLKSKLNLILVTLAAFTFAVPFAGYSATEAELIAVLKSDAARKEKADACRELAIVGTKAAVPALAALLADEEMNHMARNALEVIPDPSADAALRDALGQLKGRPLVGVIGSLGVRRDANAVPALAKFLTDKQLPIQLRRNTVPALANPLTDADPDVTQAAARALGKIGTPAAVAALQEAITKTSAANLVAFSEGLFRAAESFVAAKQNAAALKVFASLRALPQAPHQVRAGALRGAILASSGKAATDLLLEGIRSDDYVLTAAAARSAIEMAGNADVTKALVAELPKLQGDKQTLFIQVCGKRADAAAYPALFALAKSGAKNMRIEAIKALPEIGKPGAVPVLVELMKDAEVAGPAQDALAGFPGKEADAAVIAMLNANTPEQKVQGIDLAARRRMKDAVPALTKAAADSDVKVRTAALRRLGELGGPSELQPLVDLLLKTTGGQELGALEQGLIAICNAIGQPDQASEKLIAAMGPAKGAQKSSLLRVLGAIGGGKALQAVRGAVGDADADVHSTAIRTLGEWKTPDVAEALLDIAKTSTKATDKVLSLRSYLKIADSADVKAPDKIAMCKQAEALITRDEEKRSLLGVLGKAGMEALPMIAPYMDNAGTKEEAAAAVVAVAEKAIRPGRPTGAPAAARLAPPLEKVVQTTANDGLKKKAQALLAQLPANK